MATRLGAEVSIDQSPLVACRWCGQRTRPRPACEACGSPLDLRLRIDTVPAFSDDLLEWQIHSRRPGEDARDPLPTGPPASIEGESDRSAQDVVARTQTIADVPAFPPEAPPPSSVEPPPAASPERVIIESSRAWGASPAPAVQARIQKEIATTWGARVGGFFGLVLLLDFVLSHL